MKNRLLAIFCILLACITNLCPRSFSLIAEEVAEGQVFTDYQNYNHGYCPDCSCCPCRCIPVGPGPCGSGTCDPCDSDACDPYGGIAQPVGPAVELPPGSPGPGPLPPPPPGDSACNPCAPPCAPKCGTECGISVCALGIAIAAIATAAVLIICSGSGG